MRASARMPVALLLVLLTLAGCCHIQGERASEQRAGCWPRWRQTNYVMECATEAQSWICPAGTPEAVCMAKGPG